MSLIVTQHLVLALLPFLNIGINLGPMPFLAVIPLFQQASALLDPPIFPMLFLLGKVQSVLTSSAHPQPVHASCHLLLLEVIHHSQQLSCVGWVLIPPNCVGVLTSMEDCPIEHYCQFDPLRYMVPGGWESASLLCWSVTTTLCSVLMGDNFFHYIRSNSSLAVSTLSRHEISTTSSENDLPHKNHCRYNTSVPAQFTITSMTISSAQSSEITTFIENNHHHYHAILLHFCGGMTCWRIGSFSIGKML